jgi:membrane-associated phospholipid phosphatase
VAALRLARFVSHAFSPPVVAAVVVAAVSWRGAGSVAEALRWTALLVLFSCVGPLLVVVVALRLGRVGDLYISRREQRPRPLALAALSVVGGVLLLSWLGAPGDVVAVAWAIAAGMLGTTAVTLVWKISYHAGAVAGALGVLALAFGPTLLAAAPILALVGWARVRLDAHTPAQVLAGTLLGGTAAAVAFALAR